MDQPIVDKSALVDAVAADECNTTPEAVSGQERKRVHISLHQVHIPKLVEAGVIEREDRHIAVGPNARELDKYRHDSRSGVVTRLKQAIR